MGGYTVQFSAKAGTRSMPWCVIDDEGEIDGSWGTEREARESAARENAELARRGEERIRRLQALRDEVVDRLSGLGSGGLDREAGTIEEAARLLGIKGWAVFS